MDEVKGLILELYSQLGDKPLLSKLYQFRRYYKLIKDIQKKLTQLGLKQERIFTDAMEKFYKENCEILADQFEKPFELTDIKIKATVSHYLIDNTLWSESIWKDKALLLSKIRHELVMNVATGKTVEQMADSLVAERLTTNFYNAKRLIRTEIVKYYVNTTIERYKDAGVKEVKYHAVMDDRTCEQCKEKNGKKFSINSHSLPPTHPNCRCFITPVI